MRQVLVVAVDEAAKRAEHRAFALRAAAGARCRRDDPIRQARQWQRLQPDAARTAQRREEQTFAREQRTLQFADVLNVEIDTRLKSDDAPRIDTNHFARLQIAQQLGTAGMDDHEPVAVELLHDEALAAEQPCAEASVVCDAEPYT